jgi:lipoprotein-anchoring transpeptidase ErfK/SrfK
MAKQAKLSALSYTTVTELLSERFHCTPELLVFLNPDTDWSTGSVVTVPNVVPTWVRADVGQLEEWVQQTYGSKSGREQSAKRNGTDSKNNSDEKDEAEDAEAESDEAKSEKTENGEADSDKAESDEKADELAGQKTDDGRITSSGLQMVPEGELTVIVSKEDTSLNVLDEQGQVVFYAPVTAGSEHDPLPLGEWKVNGTERFPKFNYNPELFWDAEDDDKKAKIPAGPNNPVGVAWIDISKPHYGLHGTPEAEKIGYTESHGCVRLTNWDVLRLADMVKPETQVLFVETEDEVQEVIKNRQSGQPAGEDKEED